MRRGRGMWKRVLALFGIWEGRQGRINHTVVAADSGKKMSEADRDSAALTAVTQW
jgi:hypothetical protein